ncbi:MAG: 4-hydroxy-tetrahydrodipicolinate reductase [Ahrensia sp.]|nr:4-hydroxy-tetrahydrodipicolinate reductase [Ahrensia sp.]
MSLKINIAVTGASGRMGGALIRAIDENPFTVLSGALERDGSDMIGHDSGKVAGLKTNEIEITDNLNVAFKNAHVIVDFTMPQATLVFAEYASTHKIAHIIGTTGFSAVQEAAIARAAQTTAIMKSGNMSMGVIMLSVLVERAAKALVAADWDIEVLEMHHKHKVDAPSGTALLLGQAAADGRGIDLSANSVRSRDGHTGARQEGSIGFSTMRGGSVVGDHSVMLAGVGESITLSHRAEDRSIFAKGAIKAAIWAHAQSPGLYSMRDVLGLND